MNPDMLAGGSSGGGGMPQAGPAPMPPGGPTANPAMMLAQLLRKKGGTKGKHRKGGKKKAK